MIYKALNESIIQDEDNIGNDLEAIENEIFNDEEDNIVEETFMTIYEMEYNSNVLLKNIGLMQLSEVVNGEDAKENILVRVWKAIKKFFIDLWDKVKELWGKFLDKLGIRNKYYKSFLKECEEKEKEIDNADTKLLPAPEKIKINEGYFKDYIGRLNSSVVDVYLQDQEINEDIEHLKRLIKMAKKGRSLKTDYEEDDNKERIYYLKRAIDFKSSSELEKEIENLNITAIGKLLKDKILSVKGNEIEIELTNENIKKYKEAAKKNLLAEDDFIKSLKKEIREANVCYESIIKSFNEIEPELQSLNVDKNDQAHIINFAKRLQWEMKSFSYLSSIVLSTATSEFEAARFQSKKLLEHIFKYTYNEEKSTNESFFLFAN